MNAKERGFLLLTSALGDPQRKPLTVAQFRTLAMRVRQMERPRQSRELTEGDIISLGYDRYMAQRIVQLLQYDGLDYYLRRGEMQDCCSISRVSDAYPSAVRKRLGLDAPGCLWAKGDVTLLRTRMLSLVGSRELSAPNAEFAKATGKEAARQGITLVSGNARGADRVAQEACLQAGGSVICVVADELQKYPLKRNVLYLSEDSFDLPFTPQRALSRNRVIHALGYLSVIAQCEAGIGGTWDGTVKNLRNGWSPVYCFDDGSCGAKELEQLGATLITESQLCDFSALHADIESFIK